MLLLSGIETFIIDHNIIINFVLSVIGVIFSILSYVVAKKIFDKGVQIDKKKVLRQISLEFVIGFFIPFSKFKSAICPILGSSTYGEKSVFYVINIINEYKFSVQFPYFDTHIGNLWDALDADKKGENIQAFNTILNFVKDVRRFDRAITDLYDRLDAYLMDSSESKESSGDLKNRNFSTTLEDFFNTQGIVTLDMFNKGMEMITKLSEYEKTLPKELNISEMNKVIKKDY